ncbi:unnamed protein product [Caretta caretta]
MKVPPTVPQSPSTQQNKVLPILILQNHNNTNPIQKTLEKTNFRSVLKVTKSGLWLIQTNTAVPLKPVR